MFTAMKKLIFFLSFLFTFNLLAKSQTRYQAWFSPNPPFQYRGSELVEVTFKTTQETIKKLVPEPLIPNSDNLLSISIGRQIIPSLISAGYLEMYVTIPVEYNGKSGQYWTLLYLEDPGAITGGREIWGFPKFGADLEFEKKDNKVSASIVRYGTKLLELSADLGQTNPKTTTIEKSLSFTVKEIPSVEENSPPAILQLNSVNFRNIRYYDYQECNNLVFKLFEVDAGLMPNLPVEEIISAVFYKMDFILDYGKVEYDYLKNGLTSKEGDF